MAVEVPANDAKAEFAQCADGIDNDHDGRTDYPQDVQCASIHDDSEGPTGRGLFISVSDRTEIVEAGDSLTYNVGLRTEWDTGKEVDVFFHMPHQTNLIAASDGGRRQENYIVWKNVSVYPGKVRNLSVSVSVNPHAKKEMLLIAEVSSEGVVATDTTRVEHNVVPYVANLDVGISDGKKYADPGETLKYRVTVANPTGMDQTANIRATIPAHTTFISCTECKETGGTAYQWNNQLVRAGEMREYWIAAYVDKSAQQFEVLNANVSVGAVRVKDSTSVYSGVLPTGFSVSLDDGKDEVAPGEQVTYAIDVRNNTEKLATEVDIQNKLPTYAEFVSATEGGQWTGKQIYWDNLTVSPFGSRKVFVTIRVRSDAPEGTSLRNAVIVKGREAVDLSTISRNPHNVRRSIGNGYSSTGVVSKSGKDVVLRKVADRGEVRPGDTVRYTIYLRNTTNRPLHNVQVDDRMDSSYVSVINADRGRAAGSNLNWNIPSLSPGQEWKTSYTVRIAAHTPHGVTLNNIVTVSGEGMETLSLSERVHTTQLGVVYNLPPTGAGFDAIFLGLTGLIGGAQAFAQRRKYLIS